MIVLRALAEYFECEPESITGYVIACERGTQTQGLILSSVWSAGVPFWRLRSFADELKHHLQGRDLRPVEDTIGEG